MTAYNFPNSPSDGDTETANGITYTYSSSKTRWDAAAASGSSTTVYATIDLLPLSGASTGDQAYVSGNNRLYIWNGTGWYNIALINTTPSISGVSSSYGLAADGTATTVTITATDPEGVPITYSIASDTSGNVATVSQGTGSNTNVFTITPSTNTANGGTFSLTFRASDGVNIATAVSEFTLVFGIPNSQFTTALVTSVGANNAVNNSFDDASTNNHTITANGNVTQNTFSPHRHGGYSTYFDGSGDTLTASGAVVPTSGPFTVQCWAWLNDTSTCALWSQGSGGGSASRTSVSVENNKWWAQIGSTIIGTSTTPLTKEWIFVEFQFNGSQIEFFVNGTSIASANTTTNAENVSFKIGGLWASGYDFEGYITDLKVMSGTPSGSSAVPTERLTATSGTEMLTCHLPYIVDGSTNGHSITVNGDTKTEPLSPYDHGGYTSGSNGASMYFDGSGDYLSLPVSDSLKFGTGAFTIEFWMWNQDTNHINNSSYYPCQIQIGTFGQNNIAIRFNNAGTEFRSSINGTNTSHTVSIPEQTWSHVAFTRDSSGDCRFFLGGTQIGSTYSNTSTIDPVSETRIGRENWTNGEYFKGSLSDVRVVKGSSVYTSAFTPPTAPLTAITNTSLLLSGTGAGIIDKSQSVKAITLNGDTKSSTTQSKYLTSSMYFDGTGDYLQMDNQNVGDFGTLDFTAEGWIYLLDNSALYTVVDGRPSTLTSASGWSVAVSTSGELYIYSGGFLITGASSAVTANNWHHWAYTRENGTHKLFLNGTQTGSSSTASRDFTAQLFRIGASGTGGEVFKGYQSDVRITKGLARYTSNFTVPAAALQG